MRRRANLSRRVAPRGRLVLLSLCVLVVAACSREKSPLLPSALPPSATPPPVQASAAEVAQNYFDRWTAGQYTAMYDLLGEEAQQGISRERFAGRHEAIAEEARITATRLQLLGEVPESGERTAARYAVAYSTTIWGEIRQENSLQLVKEPAGWRVAWSPSLIFRELTGQNLVRAVVDTPKRGAILDRAGQPLAVTATVATVGTAKNLINVPSIVPDRAGLIGYLAARLGMSAEEIRAKLDDPRTQTDLFIPLKTLPPSTPRELIDELEGTGGVVIQRSTRRSYPYGAAAAHVVGYVTPISAEQLAGRTGEGYQAGDLIGAVGLEASMERQLAGQRGARLTVITPEGGQVGELAKRAGQPALDVVTTLDVNAQLAVEAALGDRTGSAVLLDPRDNSVVAMASHPTFDPNVFLTGPTPEEAKRLFEDPRKPLINRSIGATYPPGSTFKVITAAAGLERGGFTASWRTDCVPTWFGLGPNLPKNNWNKQPEGLQTIAEGLMRSCNPVFYEIGLKLDGVNPRILGEYATAFGFGRSTGISGLEDATGVSPGPDWKKQALNEGWFTGDSVNMSIGQGFLLATPLQIANAYSAIAHGSSLRTVVLVREVRDPANGNKATESYRTSEVNRLPITPATLAVLRDGTAKVTQDPRGTAFSVFQGSRLDPAGKSGTAEDQGVQEHALFAAYAPRNSARGVAVVVLDEGKSGSLEAGPITRRILEAWVR